MQDGQCFSFALGNVAGKGPSAALLSALIQGMLSIAAPGCVSPASIVARVNTALCARGIQSRFATLFYGGLDPRGRFTYCNGYRDGTATLAPGDRIVIFSDGVSEALSRGGEEFGDDRILEILESVRAGSTDLDPTSLVEALLAAVRIFTEGAGQSDDITAMVVQYRGQEGFG